MGVSISVFKVLGGRGQFPNLGILLKHGFLTDDDLGRELQRLGQIGESLLGQLVGCRALRVEARHRPKLSIPNALAVYVEPINVFGYWIVCIGLTLILSLIGFWVLFANTSASNMPRPPTLARSFLLGCLKPVLKRIANGVSDGLGPERRLKVSAIYGAISQRLNLRRDAVCDRPRFVMACFRVEH